MPLLTSLYLMEPRLGLSGNALKPMQTKAVLLEMLVLVMGPVVGLAASVL